MAKEELNTGTKREVNHQYITRVVKQTKNMIIDCFSFIFFFLEHTGDLRLFVLLKRKNGPIQHKPLISLENKKGLP